MTAPDIEALRREFLRAVGHDERLATEPDAGGFKIDVTSEELSVGLRAVAEAAYEAGDERGRRIADHEKNCRCAAEARGDRAEAEAKRLTKALVRARDAASFALGSRSDGAGRGPEMYSGLNAVVRVTVDALKGGPT